MYVNGLAQSGFITEDDPAAGEFSLDTAPETGDNISVAYQYAPSATGNADTLDGYHLSGILEAIYPVGSIYIGSDDGTMPALIASIGTWQRVEGMFIVGASDSDTDFDYDDTGGAKSHSLVNANLPRYNGTVTMHGAGSGGATVMWSASGSGISAGTSRSQYRSGGSNTAGANSLDSFSLNIGQSTPTPVPTLPPYKAKYIWERIA